MPHERRFNAAMAGKLEDPERLHWLPPAEVIAALAMQPGQAIVDIGAGTGYFALPLAKAVGSSGKIYAVDAQREMLSILAGKLPNAALATISLICAEAESTGLPQGCCDLVFMANVWHEFDDRAAVVAEAMRLLRRGGRVGVLDWRPDVEPDNGPPLDHRLSPDDAMATLRAAGVTQLNSMNVGKYAWLVTGIS